MKRRDFLNRSARLIAGFGALGCAGLSCRGGHDFDLILKRGTVLDGTGRAGFIADVGIRGARIGAVGQLRESAAARVIDAAGLVVAPGFIDVHTHSEKRLLTNPRAESKVRQGVTTEILGQDGDSFHPEQFPAEFQNYVQAGVALNVASMVGQGTIREVVMGMTDRPATADELTRMRALAATALRDGAVGISSGLEYTPGGFASTREITNLCRVMQGTGGIYATHMRNEDDRLIEAVEEAIAIADGAKVGLHISHLKCQGRRNWHKLDEVFARIRSAEQAGLAVTMDRYPYVAYSTGLSNLMPLWCREGGTERFIQRLVKPEILARIKQATLAKVASLGSWDAVMITSVNLEKHKRFEGKTIAELTRESGQDPFAFTVNLLVEEKNRVGMVGFAMSEANTVRILAHPNCMPASDGSALATYGALSQGNPHPRSYGTFPRVLGKYVREQQIMPLAEAVRKMTSLAAARFGLGARGQIREHFMADFVLFDAATIRDTATFAQPHQYPEGIAYVLVNGQVVIDRGEHTGVLPGRVLKGGIQPVI